MTKKSYNQKMKRLAKRHPAKFVVSNKTVIENEYGAHVVNVFKNYTYDYRTAKIDMWLGGRDNVSNHPDNIRGKRILIIDIYFDSRLKSNVIAYRVLTDKL